MVEERVQGKSAGQQELRYPRLIRRIQAAIIDGAILSIAFFTAGVIISAYEIHGGLKASIVALLLIILEPGLVSITGGSIGHHLRGLRVQNYKHGTNINIFRATIRFLVKILFGWLSFVFILVTKRYQAFHDMISGSVVVLRDSTKVPEYEAVSERGRGAGKDAFFSESSLLAISLVFEKVGNVMTEVELAEIFGKCNIPIAERSVEDASYPLFEALNAKQSQDGHRRTVLAFLRVAMNPERYQGQEENFELRRQSLNEALAPCGLEVGEDGGLSSLNSTG
jgi:uncharacterized RDD family membrane protein YckC